MKQLNIAHFILTLALLIIVAAMGYMNYRQQRILSVMADALLTIQQAELYQMQPCEEENKRTDVRTLARR